jgi:hypothetical protein
VLAGGDWQQLRAWIMKLLSSESGCKGAVAAEIYSAAMRRYGQMYAAPHHRFRLKADSLACDTGFEQFQELVYSRHAGPLLSWPSLAFAVVAGMGMTDGCLHGDKDGHIFSLRHGCQAADAKWAVLYPVWMQALQGTR